MLWLSFASRRSAAADEGHRIKSMEAQLFATLTTSMCDAARHRVLMTGTPIQVRHDGGLASVPCRDKALFMRPPPPPQNHMGELFALLHWLNKDVFTSEAAFLAEFGDLGTASEAVRARLTSLLRPHILRRTKEDVLKTLPARHEVLVPVPLSTAQTEMCRMILTRSYELLHVTAGKAAAGPGGRVGKASLINVLMELRKAASHPYLITGAEESLVRRALLDAARAGSADPAAAVAAQAAAPTLALGPDDAYRLFVGVSGKLQFLQRLLPRLAQRGSRVLIFSAFTMVLDILEDFLRGLVMPPLLAAAAGAAALADGGDSAPAPSLTLPPGYRPGRTLLYSRIDGSTDHRMRQRVVDAFNRPASRLFALLMTTRAGGQGLNLATADTVIIFDRSGGRGGGGGREGGQTRASYSTGQGGGRKAARLHAHRLCAPASRRSDFNPHMDRCVLGARLLLLLLLMYLLPVALHPCPTAAPCRQAQARAHRIGQTRPVVVYRLVSAGTCEETIVARAAEKLKLEQLAIHDGGKAGGGSKSGGSKAKVGANLSVDGAWRGRGRKDHGRAPACTHTLAPLRRAARDGSVRGHGHIRHRVWRGSRSSRRGSRSLERLDRCRHGPLLGRRGRRRAHCCLVRRRGGGHGSQGSRPRCRRGRA